MKIFFNRLCNKINKKKKSKIILTQNQIHEIIEMAKEELEVRRIANVVNIMMDDYEYICEYIENLHYIIDKLSLEINNLEKCLVYENIKIHKTYL